VGDLVDVARRAVELERVAAVAPLDRVLSEQLPQPRHVRLHDPSGGRRRGAGPEDVDDPIRPQRLARMESQQRQENSRLPRRQLDPAPAVHDLQRAEETNVHLGAR
jgi:hypothetical protein